MIVIVDERYRNPFSHPPITYIFNPLKKPFLPRMASIFFFFEYQPVVVMKKISYTSKRGMNVIPRETTIVVVLKLDTEFKIIKKTYH